MYIYIVARPLTCMFPCKINPSAGTPQASLRAACSPPTRTHYHAYVRSAVCVYNMAVSKFTNIGSAFKYVPYLYNIYIYINSILHILYIYIHII